MSERASWFEQIASAGLGATAEALFPPNDGGYPDCEDTDLVARTAAWIQSLPEAQRFQLTLLYFGVEVLTPVLRPFGAGGPWRFSARTLEQRAQVIAGWRGSWVYPLRLFADALKTSVTMIYLAHPAVVRHIGEYKPWAHPDDAFEVDVRPIPVEGCR